MRPPAHSPVPSLPHRIDSIHRRSHQLWTSEPEVTLERRRSLMDDLGAIDRDADALMLATLDDASVTTPASRETDVAARLAGLERRLARLEHEWCRPAA